MSLLKKTADQLTVADHLKLNGIVMAAMVTMVTAPFLVSSAVSAVRRRFTKNDVTAITE